MLFGLAMLAIMLVLSFGMKGYRAQLREQARVRADIRYLTSLSPKRLQEEVARREAAREAQARADWQKSPEEYAADLTSLFPSWERDEIADRVRDRELDKLQRNGVWLGPIVHQPTPAEVSAIEQWVQRYCANGSK